MNVNVLEPSDHRWRDVLQEFPHDIYHQPEYAGFSARQDDETASAFLIEDSTRRCLIPLIIRPLPALLGFGETWRDGISPYGYPAPIASPDADSHWWCRCLEAFIRAAEERGIVTVFLRWHPLFPGAERSPLSCERLVCHGETVYVRLDETEEEWTEQTRSVHRYDVRRLEREGFRVQFDDWDQFDQFIDIYQATMRRLESDEFYTFNDEYFLSLREAVGQWLHLGSVVSHDGEIAAASLFTECNGIVQYHLSGTAEPFLKRAPTKLLLHSVRSWAKARGNQRLHLGGGVGGRNDSLFQFKAGFSRHRSNYHTSQFIINETRYQEAVQRAAVSFDGSFFPAYRRLSR